MTLKIIMAKDYVRQPMLALESIDSSVKDILKDIATQGDDAINAWSQKIDGYKPQWIQLKPFEDYQIDTELADAIRFAHKRIKNFAEFQIKNLSSDKFEDEFGTFGFKYEPMNSIAAYIPAGQFPLISSALMTLTPATVAGCQQKIACSPSDHPAILAAASLAGADKFLKIGGAQAIGAMSYGYDDIDAVDMIVGPGNAYVNAAKTQVMQRTSIDSLAGPSEILIYAEKLARPEWIITDALAQAEHDLNAKSLIVSCNQKLINKLQKLLIQNSNYKNLIKNQQIELILCENQSKAIQFINNYAPEHLMVCDESLDQDLLKNYGALFIGENSGVAFGDYCSGPNHTLPTNAFAKRSGGLGVHSFLKITTQQQLKNISNSEIIKHASTLANSEGLKFHNKSIELRK